MQPFAELGALVEGRWRDKNYDENIFPSIAARALRETDLTARVDPWEIIRWVHTTTDLPHQMDPHGKFGNPPITLHAGSDSMSAFITGWTALPASTNIDFPAPFRCCWAAVCTATTRSKRSAK